MPERIQLSRAKGWRMPPGTVKVDRTTKWGNPFIVGQHGTRAECVSQFEMLLCGYVAISMPNAEAQQQYLDMTKRDISHLRGKSLACWCPKDAPCHAGVLLRAAACCQSGDVQVRTPQFLLPLADELVRANYSERQALRAAA